MLGLDGLTRQNRRCLVIAAAPAFLVTVTLAVVLIRGSWGFREKLMAPAPASALDAEWEPTLPASTLNVPITYDLTPIMQELEEAVDVEYGSMDERHELESNDRVAVAYAFRRSPFRARLDGDIARVSTTITYQAQGWYDAPLLPDVRASCGMDDDGDEPPRLVVALSARMELDDNWGLSGNAHLDRLAPATDEERDKCQVTPLRIDMTDRVISAATDVLVERLPRMEAAIAAIDLRSRFERWWNILQEPIELTDDVWLTINPSSVHRGLTQGEGQTLIATVGLTSFPRIELGPRPTPVVRPLPALDSATVGEGLRIHATGRADYGNISEQLDQRLAGKTMEREGRTLRIQRLRLRGIGAGRLALEVTFDGDAKGRVFLVGTPKFDESGQVHVPDLEFDLASSSLLVSSYAWLQDVGITQLLREEARWPLDDLSVLAAEQLTRGLNRFLNDEVELRGKVISVEILGVYARTDALLVQAQAKAEAELVIAPPGANRSPKANDRQ